MFQLYHINVAETYAYAGTALTYPSEPKFVEKIQYIKGRAGANIQDFENKLRQQFAKYTYFCIAAQRQPNEKDFRSIVDALLTGITIRNAVSRENLFFYLRRKLPLLVNELNQTKHHQEIVRSHFEMRLKIVMVIISRERANAKKNMQIV